MQVVSTNPAALGDGAGTLQDRLFEPGASVLDRPITTPWVAYPNLYSAASRSSGDATWLQINANPNDPRPQVSDTQGPLWGLHGDDMSLAIGDLAQDVKTEEAAFSR